jgi:hypothetical protein
MGDIRIHGGGKLGRMSPIEMVEANIAPEELARREEQRRKQELLGLSEQGFAICRGPGSRTPLASLTRPLRWSSVSRNLWSLVAIQMTEVFTHSRNHLLDLAKSFHAREVGKAACQDDECDRGDDERPIHPGRDRRQGLG